MTDYAPCDVCGMTDVDRAELKTLRLRAERAEADCAALATSLRAMLDCIKTEPMMDGSERNPAINDRRCMLVAIRNARALLAKTETR